MRYSAFVLASISASASAHGVITMVMGANGVNMPGLSVQDGTPRDCATPRCGAEQDTSIIRQNELGTGKASALGRTKANGPVMAANVISIFMGNSTSGANTQQEQNVNIEKQGGGAAAGLGVKRGLLGNLLGGGNANGGSSSTGTTTQGTKTAAGTTANAVKAAAGQGATKGLPTTDDTGAVSMMFHQVNQDGAGPLSADIDATSGGSDPSAFKQATVMTNVPGIGIGGLSAATTTDFPVKVQMPQGMTCSGNVGGASNVCIVRMQNQALAGPFGGSGAFTQSSAAKKRAIEYNLRKRQE